ncbi:MAG: flavodoxin family protein [Bacilli bacterium]|nr:flavodoxin family protein [Bacilli bacterium]
MNLLINGSNREKNNYNILNDIKSDNDELISLANKNIKFCIGCNSCLNKLENHCVLNDYITEIYSKILKADKIVFASPLYMSNITATLKALIDRLAPFYYHSLFQGKEISLILTGQGTEEENETEIKAIIDYFTGISEWMDFKFKFLAYFTSGDLKNIDDVKIANIDYDQKINKIKEELN